MLVYILPVLINPLAFIIISLTIILGTVIVITSSHWLLIWIGFEINILAVIPILIKRHNPRAVEAATKYFLTQATASILLMLAVVTNLLYSGQWTVINITNPLASITITLALAIKLGLSPFHFWVPEVTQGVPLSSGLILLTWQKLAPLSILYQISHSINPSLLLTISLMSIAIGGWGGLNQTQLRKILAYSSIAHMGWITAVLIYSPTLTLVNLTLYIFITLSTFILFIHSSSTTALTLSHLWNKSPVTATSVLIIILSLGGLPPLTGFLPKWIIIQELTKNENIILPTLIAMIALLSLYFYMRLTYSTSLTLFPSINNMKIKWQLKTTKQTPLLAPLIMLSTLTLPLAPILSTLN